MKPPHNNGPRGRSQGRPHRHGAGPAPSGVRHAPSGGERAQRPAGEAAPRGERLHLPQRPGDPSGETQRLGAKRQGGHPAPPHRQEGQKAPRPGADAPRGTVWLYGLHAVAAALANPNRRLRRLLLTGEAEASLAAKLPQPWPVAAERAERARLEQLLGREVAHQGAALLADPLASPTLAQALERPGPVLVLDQVSDPRNVGAILRAAAAFGAAAVITQDRNAPEETGALAKAASGALEKLPLFRAVNIARTLVALKAAGCWVIGLDAACPYPGGGSLLSGPALRQRRVALVLGSEGEGLRRLTRDTCDEIVSLAVPKGHVSEMESLNVSAAAAIALYELTRPG
jgi:23S rRNA (guanosine2251-2'-O)-methyltransferase